MVCKLIKVPLLYKRLLRKYINHIEINVQWGYNQEVYMWELPFDCQVQGIYKIEL